MILVFLTQDVIINFDEVILSLIVPLLLGCSLFLFLRKTSTTADNPDSTTHVVGKETMLASPCLTIFGC